MTAHHFGRFTAICNVDLGLGERRRRAFLQRLAKIKNALVPSPTYVLVVGESKNRSGGPLDASVGCSSRDLILMGDGDMKRCLEEAARAVEELRRPILLEALANMGQQRCPPSPAHELVMEAVIILLTPRKSFHQFGPLSLLRGIVWTEARHLLNSPNELWAAIASVDMSKVPPANANVLEVSRLQCSDNHAFVRQSLHAVHFRAGMMYVVI